MKKYLSSLWENTDGIRIGGNEEVSYSSNRE